MFYIILAIVTGVSFFPLLTGKMHLWLSQGMWVQTGIMLAFTWSFFEKPIRYVRNVPLGLLHLWIGLYTAFICLQVQMGNKYDVKHFFPYFNLLCMLILYQLIVKYITRKQVEIALTWMKYVLLVTLGMSVLQHFNMGQFFEMLYIDHEAMFVNHNNPVVGFIGNGTHLSGFLAMSAPLFLWKRKALDWLGLLLLFITLFFTGTTLGDPAISGFVIFFCVWFYFFKTNKTALIFSFIFIVMGGLIILPIVGQSFTSFNGRIGYWEYYFGIFKKMPITGIGLGTISTIFAKSKYPELQKLHMEYLQYLVELGIIGFFLIINVIKGFLDTKAEDQTELTLKAIVIGFLVSCCFNYPSHLWLPTSWVIFSYGSLIAIKEENNVGILT